MMRTWILWSALALASTPSLAQNTASVAGTVTDEKGAGVVGLQVVVHRLTLPPFSARATTSAGGNYSLSGMPAGGYKICVQSPSQAYVDPCEWSRRQQQFHVNQGQALTKIAVKVQAGTVVPVQVMDAGHLLEAPVNGVQPKLLVGYFTPSGIFRPSLMTQKTAQGRTYSAAIPLDTEVKFHFGVQHAQVLDPGGAEISERGSTVSVSHASSPTGSHAPLVLQVKAVKP